jgi:methylated-DNA-[protein]-cysteine S-methyltransferase
MTQRFFQSPIGWICVQGDNNEIISISFADQQPEKIGDENEAVSEGIAQLKAYFFGERKTFSLRLRHQGTPFQQKVWLALQTITFGKTCSYQAIAKLIGNAKAYRAVGNANHHNPFPIIIPCHRVIGISGSLSGYNGGIDRKKWLLAHENVQL